MEEKFEKSAERIEKISGDLRRKVLEPAKAEAAALIEEGRQRAAALVEEAQAQAQEIVAAARAEVEKERNIFESSLLQSAGQALESLRQSVEKQLFHAELAHVIDREMANPQVVAELLQSIIKAIEQEGVQVELEAFIPSKVSTEEVNALLAKKMVERLRDGSVAVTTIKGGAQVKLVGKNLMLDISSDVLRDLMAHYLRKDYRKLLFTDG